MGFSNYFKAMPPVTKNLLLVNIFIFLVVEIAGLYPQVNKYLALHYFTSPMFNPAQLLTYMFMHGGLAHVFFNMFSLFMFGPMVEYSIGSKRFLFFYISCGIGAGLVQEGVFAIMLHKYVGMFSPEDFQQIIHEGARAIAKGMNFTDPTLATINDYVNTPVVGASGAVFGLLVGYAVLFPNQIIYLLVPPMPVKAKYLVIGFVIVELALGAWGTADGVAHFAHIGGALFGFLIIYYWKKNTGTTYGPY